MAQNTNFDQILQSQKINVLPKSIISDFLKMYDFFLASIVLIVLPKSIISDFFKKVDFFHGLNCFIRIAKIDYF